MIQQDDFSDEKEPACEICGYYCNDKCSLTQRIRELEAKNAKLDAESERIALKNDDLRWLWTKAEKRAVAAEAKVARVEEMCKSDPRLFFTSTQIQAALQEPEPVGLTDAVILFEPSHLARHIIETRGEHYSALLQSALDNQL